MALTAIQKKLMRKALCAGWYNPTFPRDRDMEYRVTPQDLTDLAQMDDESVIEIATSYKTWKISLLNTKKDGANNIISTAQTEIDDLNI